MYLTEQCMCVCMCVCVCHIYPVIATLICYLPRDSHGQLHFAKIVLRILFLDGFNYMYVKVWLCHRDVIPSPFSELENVEQKLKNVKITIQLTLPKLNPLGLNK